MAKTTAVIMVGTKVRFQHPTSSGGTVHFSARVAKIQGDSAWVEMPSRVRSMPFAPLGGKRYGLFKLSDLVVRS